ncbi:MAG: O-antigen ligase family protein [Chloroflexota bacterium]|nr:O-antigen ligase family protein [Chloroflexota bacterium]
MTPSSHRSATIAPAAAAAAVVGAGLAGALLALGGVLGLGAVVALVYAPLVLVNLAVAISLWVPVIFFEGLPGATNAPEAGLLLLVVGWLAVLRQNQRIGEVLRAHRRVLLVALAFFAWTLTTSIWAPEPALALDVMPSYLVVGLIYVIVLSALASAQRVRLLALCFVLGVAASVTLGLAGGQGALGGALYEEGRLNGGMGDPNDLAVAIVAALALIGGLLPSIRTLLGRWVAGTALIVVLLVGLAATASRGGLVAAAAAALAALYFQSGRRLQVLGVLCAALVIAGISFASQPAALERVTQDKYGGSGRTDLWQLAWREVQDHPIHGVGSGNFAVAARPYLREPGVLTGVKFIERGHEAHNLYLGLLAETGIIGLLLYLVIPFTAVRTAVVAGRRFEASGEYAAGSLARGVATACIGVLTAAVFLSDAADKRLWLLYALGPALLAAATIPAFAPARRKSARPGADTGLGRRQREPSGSSASGVSARN